MSTTSFTARFPYSGPQHDRQKLLRASLASSCLRGGMRVWQFMAGVRGAEVRRQPHRWRTKLLQSGVFHRVAREPSLCGEELVRPMRDFDYRAVGMAFCHGHTEMSEWCMSGQLPAFTHGIYHVRADPHGWLGGPLPILMRSACEIDWDWGRRRIEQLVAESDDPGAVGMRESGEYAVALALASGAAGSPNSLQWAEAFAADAGEEVMSRFLETVLQHSAMEQVAGTCTLGVAEWLWQWQATQSDLSAPVFHAASRGNWAVMEWLVQTGSVDDDAHDYFAAAAKNDSVSAMRFLRDHGLDTYYTRAGLYAASSKGLSVLEWLWSEKPEFVTSNCVETAARCGDVGKVRFLMERCGLEWTEAAAFATAGHGHVCVLEWAHDRGLAMPQRPHDHGRRVAIIYPVVQFLLAYAPDLQCNVDDMAMACRQDLRVVEALHARFPDLLSQDAKGSCLAYATAAGRMDVVEFILCRVEAPLCTEDVLAGACAADRLDLVQLLHDRFPDVALSSKAMTRACFCGALEVVEWLYTEHGLAPDPATTMRAGNLRVMEFFVRHCGVGSPLDPLDLTEAVRYQNLHVVEYLVWRATVNDVGSLLRMAEAKNSHWPMQRFLRRHVVT